MHYNILLYFIFYLIIFIIILYILLIYFNIYYAYVLSFLFPKSKKFLAYFLGCGKTMPFLIFCGN